MILRVEPRPATRADVPRSALQLLAVAAASLVLGGLTSVAQGALPDAVGAFANSATGWTALTAALVAVCRARPLPSAVLGAASFLALVLGYSIVSTWRGFPTSEELFLAASVVVGPFVGVAASWLRHRDLRAALGAGALAGIALGEAAYGLVVVSATTGWIVWTVFGAAGIALLAVETIRIQGFRDRLLAIALTAAVALAFFAVYRAAGSLPF